MTEDEDVLAEWTEVDEIGTEKKVRIIDRGDEVEISTFHPDPGIMGKVTVQDTESLGKAIREMD